MRVSSTALLSLACSQLGRVVAFPTPTPGPLDAPDALSLLLTILPNISGPVPPPYLDTARYRSLALAQPPLRRNHSPPERAAASLFTRLRRGLIDIINPKYVPNPKHTPTSSATPRPTSTAKPSATSSPPAASATPTPPASTRCYPGNSPDIPTTPATASSLASWWCPHATEFAFMGFSYDQTPCQSGQQLVSQFTAMKKTYGARYVRLYGVCDDPGYLPRLVEAAAEAKLGVYALVWFGFDGDSKWKDRMARLVKLIQTNPKAPYVIRTIAVGSEPLFDHVLSANDLAAQVTGLRSTLKPYGIETTISEMPYGFQSNNDAPQIFKAIQMVQGNVLPFFDQQASWGGNAWGVVSWSVSYFREHAPGMPIRLTQTGWPSNTNIWPANNDYAVASVGSQAAYFGLLDQKCSDMKAWGVGWFSQIWDDGQLDGWGILDYNGKPKFTFAPRTSC